MFLKLLLAHLLGDFFLQPKAWLLHKEKKRLRSVFFYLHFIIHGVLVHALVRSWMVTLIIVLSHAVIDFGRIHFTRKLTSESSGRRLYVVDQILHLAVLAGIVFWLADVDLHLLANWTTRHLKYIVAVVFLTAPSSAIVKLIIARWNPEKDQAASSSLDNAGKYIGILERLFVFGFVAAGHLEAVGFLLAAKSVFRFGDLKEAEDRQLTEYILIGTLVSFGLALLVGALVTGIGI